MTLQAVRALRSVSVTGYNGKEATVDHYPRCWNCGRPLAAYMSRPWSIRCSHHGCKQENRSAND